jgi:hypothetical protein
MMSCQASPVQANVLKSSADILIDIHIHKKRRAACYEIDEVARQ